MNIWKIVAGPVLDIIDKAVPDRTKANELKSKIQQTILENEASLLEAAAKVAQADSQSESWLTRNARPLTVINMLAIFNVLVIVGVFDPDYAAKIIEALAQVPNALWALIGGGIGVYQVARGVDKALKK